MVKKTVFRFETNRHKTVPRSRSTQWASANGMVEKEKEKEEMMLVGFRIECVR